MSIAEAPLKDLSTFLKPDQIRKDTPDLQTYGRDWTKHIHIAPSAVVFPRSTDEVVSLVQWARRHRVALVPSGGRTGLSGAACAPAGEVIVSFEKMNQILGFDEADLTITCGPGVITEALQNYAIEKGFYFPVDFASRGSSQIGGNISTNAGGIKVLRYGLMRPWVAALEVVTGTGEVLQLGKSLIKNATGYDLRQLFIGAEGTLGFITQAKLFVTRQPQDPFVFLIGVDKLEDVMTTYHMFKKHLPLLAFEMLTDVALRLVQKHAHLTPPFQKSYPYYLVAEIEGINSDIQEKALELMAEGLERGSIADGLLAQTPQQAREFWRFREDISEATSTYQPYKNDISVRIACVPEFLVEVERVIRENYPDLEVVWFGHVGDGNLHINILKPQNLTSETFLERCHQVDQILFTAIRKYDGSISAEHGVGLTKKPYLLYSRSAEEVRLMKSIKRIFDPDGILNPGKIFDL
jgi:glycolate oxidase subunit GlcD